MFIIKFTNITFLSLIVQLHIGFILLLFQMNYAVWHEGASSLLQ